MTGDAEQPLQYQFEGFTLDPKQRILRGPDGAAVPLHSRAFDTLLALVENAGAGLIEKDRLMKAVWPNAVVEENSLNKAISQVRRALGEKPGEHRFIVTVPGRGFGFVPYVQRASAAGSAEPNGRAVPPAEAIAAAIDSAADAGSSTGKNARLTSRRGPLVAALGIAAIAVAAVSAYLLSERSGLPVNPKSSVASTLVATGPTIVVLPFVDLSPNADQQKFADGLSEELMNELGELRGLRVIGRTSAFAVAGQRQDLPTITRALGVSHILEGSVRRSGDDLRIVVRLNDATSGAQLWSSTYDGKRGDIFNVQEAIARSVADKLRLVLRPEEGRRRGATPDVEAYEAYLVSSAQLSRVSTQGDIHQTTAELERVVTRDPDFALGWDALALMYSAAGDLGFAPVEESHRKSMRAATRALELAPESPRVLSTAAIMSMQLRDWPVAERRLLRALATSGGENFAANLNYGWFLDNVGRFSEALGMYRRAQALDPLSPRVAQQIENHYLLRGDFAGADAAHRKALEVATRYPWSNGYEYLRALAAGDRASVQRTLESGPSPLEVQLRNALRESRDMRAELQQLIDDPKNQASALQMDILAHWAQFFGHPELALRALRQALGPASSTFFLWRPDFKPLRSTPEFKALVRDLGLYDYWRTSGKWGDICKPRGEDDFVCE